MSVGDPSGANATWPQHFPDGCPPDDAEPTDSVRYRLVDNDPPLEDDFWSEHELVAAGRKPARRVDPILAAGVSVLETPEYAAKVRSSFGAFRAKRVAAGSLENSGVEKQTGRAGHRTWWRPIGDGAWSRFQVLS